MQAGFAFGADAPQPAHGQRRQELANALGLHDNQTVGLAEVACQLREELVRGDPDRCDQPGLCLDALLDRVGDDGRRTEQSFAAVHVEERLVEAQRLDERRETQENLANLPADGGVVFAAHRQEHAVRAEPRTTAIGIAVCTP